MPNRTKNSAAKRYWPEVKAILLIGLPMMASSASESIMMFIDRIFISRVPEIGDVLLGAAMGGGATAFVIQILFINSASMVNGLVAQYNGAGKRRRCSSIAIQGLYFAFLSIPIFIFFSFFIDSVFIFFKHEAQLAMQEARYSKILLYGGFFAVARSALAGFFVGIGKTKLVMLASLLGILINIPLDYIFIFGLGGIPRLGIVGAGLATIVSSFVILLILLLCFFGTSINKKYKSRYLLPFRRHSFMKLIRFGLPAGSESLVNMLSFNFFILLMNSYGTKVAMAASIVFSWDLLAYIPLNGLSIATTSAVGNLIGANNYERIGLKLRICLALAYLYGALVALAMFLGSKTLISPFITAVADEAEILAIAIPMLRLASIYILADATALVLIGVLRAAGDTLWLMIVNSTTHVLLFIGGSYIIIRILRLEPLYSWGLFVSSVLVLNLISILRYFSGKWKEIKMIKQ